MKEPKSIMGSFMNWYVSKKWTKKQVIDKIKEMVEQEKDNYIYCTTFLQRKIEKSLFQKS